MAITKKATILVVDDDPSILEALELGIELEGVALTTITTDTAVKGLELVSAHQPEVVVLDLQMPRMTGFDFLERLHELSLHPKVIMLTAQDLPGNVLRSIDLRAHAFVGKPFDLDRLESAIQGQLEAAWREHDPASAPDVGTERKQRNERRIHDITHYAGTTEHMPINFECECLLLDCSELIALPISEYEYFNARSQHRCITKALHAASRSGTPVLELPQFSVIELSIR